MGNQHILQQKKIITKSAITINGWLRDFLWSQASQVIQSYGSASSAYGLIHGTGPTLL